MTAAAYLVLAIAVPIFVVASVLSRTYVSNGRLMFIVAALTLYTVGNIIMVRLMREVGLGAAVSLATLAQFVLVNVVAFVIFQERPSAMQFAGTTLGAMGMALLLMPAGKG